jgi:hypothetical protein
LDRCTGALNELNGHFAVVVGPSQPAPAVTERENVVTQSAALHDLRSLGRSKERYIMEHYSFPAEVNKQHPLVQPFTLRIQQATQLSKSESGHFPMQAGQQAGTGGAAAIPPPLPSEPHLRIPIGATTFGSVYPKGGCLPLHDHGPTRQHKLFGGFGHAGIRRDVARQWHTFSVGYRIGEGELAFQTSDKHVVILHLPHGSIWVMSREAAGEAAVRPPNNKQEAGNPGAAGVVRHGVPTAKDLFITLMTKVEVYGESRQAAFNKLCGLLQPSNGASGAAGGPASLPTRVLSDVDQNREFNSAAEPGTLPLGTHHSLAGFYRHMGVAGIRRHWLALSAVTGGSMPFAFVHPDVVRMAHAYWLLHEQTDIQLQPGVRAAIESLLTPQNLRAVLRTASNHLQCQHLTPAEQQRVDLIFGGG